MKVSNHPGSEAWNSFPIGILGSRKITMFFGGISDCEMDFKKVTFCSLEDLVLMIPEVSHNLRS